MAVNTLFTGDVLHQHPGPIGRMRVVAICAQRAHDYPAMDTSLVFVVALETDLIRFVEKLIDVAGCVRFVTFIAIFLGWRVNGRTFEEVSVAFTTGHGFPGRVGVGIVTIGTSALSGRSVPALLFQDIGMTGRTVGTEGCSSKKKGAVGGVRVVAPCTICPHCDLSVHSIFPVIMTFRAQFGDRLQKLFFQGRSVGRMAVTTALLQGWMKMDP